MTIYGLVHKLHFKTVTKQEVLMLPGIGKKTVEQLEHNGVIFKA